MKQFQNLSFYIVNNPYTNMRLGRIQDSSVPKNISILSQLVLVLVCSRSYQLGKVVRNLVGNLVCNS